MTRGRAAVQVALLFVIVVPLALLARWELGNRGWGESFLPHPDSLEYAAGAQALANYGEYFLQIGPHRVPPRYPPGWPLILSLAVRAGVPGESLWRVTGVCGALLSFLLAVSAYAAAEGLRRPPPVAAAVIESWLGFGAGLTAGLVWAFAPLPVFVGQTLLSDEPCLLLSVVCLLLVVAGIHASRGDDAGDGSRPRPRVVAASWLVAGGLALGMVAAMRFVNAGLLLGPIAVLCLTGSAERRWRGAGWRLGWIAGGVGATLVAVAVLTGRMPWQWSGYAYWYPRWYSHTGDTFNLAYAVGGNPDYYGAASPATMPHLLFGLQVMLGLPGRWDLGYVGRWWPVLGWLALAWLGFRARRRRSCVGLARWLTAALAVWVLAQWALFSLYFCHLARFYLGALAVGLVAFAAGCALIAAAGGLRGAAVGLAAAITVVAMTVAMVPGIPQPRGSRRPSRAVAMAFSRWLDAGDGYRRRHPVPFDLVQAQALGLYTPESLARVTAWGKLPRQRHVELLAAQGRVRRWEVESP